MTDPDPAERKRQLNLGLRRKHGERILPSIQGRLAHVFPQTPQAFHTLDLETTDILWLVYRDVLRAARAGAMTVQRSRCRDDQTSYLAALFATLERTNRQTLVLFLPTSSNTGAIEMESDVLLTHAIAVAREFEECLGATEDGTHGLCLDFSDGEFDLLLWGTAWLAALTDA